MYKVFFYNFGYSKDFNDLEAALLYGKESGFECNVIDSEGNLIKNIKVIQALDIEVTLWYTEKVWGQSSEGNDNL